MQISDKHLILNSNEILNQFCSILFTNFQVFSFEFDRYYADGHGFTLNSISSKLTKNYLLYDVYPTYKELETYYQFSKYAYLDKSFNKNNLVFPDTKKWDTNVEIQNPFGIDERFYILNKKNNYFDVYGFSYGTHNKKILNFYIENLAIFEKFIVYFNHVAKKLIADCEKYRLLLPLNFKHNETEPNGSDSNKELFLNELDYLIEESSKNSNLYLKNIKITKTQERCLRLLATGLTVKQAAREMEISYRTVEQHVANLKDKFQLNNMKQLIHLFHESERFF